MISFVWINLDILIIYKWKFIAFIRWNKDGRK